jgi:hypothetical protein
VSWKQGEPILRRDVWRGEPKVGWAGRAVVDTHALLVVYMPEGSPLAFAPDFFGAPHPWSTRDRWTGHGVLQLLRPDDMYSVWVFWDGPEREFRGWYVNFQEPFRRTRRGFDTQDLELDIVISPDGSWRLKDDEQLERWVARGRWTTAEVAAVRAEGARIVADLDRGRRWWSEDWAAWTPDSSWSGDTLELPGDWGAAP